MDWLMPLIAGLGIGSLLKSFVDYLIARRTNAHQRWYQEKREAYLGLVEAIRKAAIKPSDEASKEFGYWKIRCELFGTTEVANLAQRMIDTTERTAEREVVFRELIQAMRKDFWSS